MFLKALITDARLMVVGLLMKAERLALNIFLKTLDHRITGQLKASKAISVIL